MWRISRLASPRKQDDGSSKYGENYAKESQVRVVVDIPKTSGYGPKSAIIKYYNIPQKLDVTTQVSYRLAKGEETN